MAIIRFPYQQVRGHWDPIIPLGVKLGTFWRPLNFYVDSGATYTILRAALVEETEFDYRQGERVYLQVGNGGLLSVYLIPLELQLGTERFICPVGISPQLGTSFNILGRRGIFDRFRVCFHESQKCLTFET